MKAAVIALYVIICVQSFWIVVAFVFTFASMRQAFEKAGAKIFEMADARYVLKSGI